MVFLFTGNVGGYIGMFLGYSVLALPNLLLTAIQKVKKVFSQRKVEAEDLRHVSENSITTKLSLKS